MILWVEARSVRHASTWGGSKIDVPILRPSAARNVYDIPPPMSTVSALAMSETSTPSLSATLAPPMTATKGRFGSSRRPPITSTSRASNLPAAEGSRVGGPTIEAWARCDAPKASFT